MLSKKISLFFLLFLFLFKFSFAMECGDDLVKDSKVSADKELLCLVYVKISEIKEEYSRFANFAKESADIKKEIIKKLQIFLTSSFMLLINDITINLTRARLSAEQNELILDKIRTESDLLQQDFKEKFGEC